MKSMKDLVSNRYSKIEEYGHCKCGAQGWKKTIPACPGVYKEIELITYDCGCEFRQYRKQAEKEANQKIRDSISVTNMQMSNLTDNQKALANLKWIETTGNVNVKRYVDSYIRNFSKNTQEGVLLIGKPGIGKTLLAIKAAYEILQKEKKYKVFFITSDELVKNMQDYVFNKDRPNYGIQAKEFDLLVLDDLGAEENKEYNYAHLFNVIDCRIRNKLPTIITTNLNGKRLTQRYVANDPDGRLMSRIAGSCRILEFADIDRRINK